MIETLDELRTSAEIEIFRTAEEDESVIGEIVAAQRKELEEEIAGLEAEAERVAEEARELAGEVPFLKMVARPRRRPQVKGGRKPDAKESRAGKARAFLSRCFGMRSRR